MKNLLAIGLLIFMSTPAFSADPDYIAMLQSWRAEREKTLREDNGWLTLAGRFTLKAGSNTFGVGKDNDVVFPEALKGTGPERLGTIIVDPDGKQVKLVLPEGVAMQADKESFTGSRMLGTSAEKRDWVGLGRIRFHIMERQGRYILRLADNESLVRKHFAGRVWYPPNEKFKVEATYHAYEKGKTIRMLNVLEEVSNEPCPGYLEFKLGEETFKLDALDDGEGLFLVFRDATAGDTTYKPARFIAIEKKPEPGKTVTVDFNKAYNPPCAFSEFTSCPVAPRQNILKIKIEAGEKYRER